MTRRPSLYYLRNPVSHEIKVCGPKEAYGLLRYQWTKLSPAEVTAYRQALVERATAGLKGEKMH